MDEAQVARHRLINRLRDWVAAERQRCQHQHPPEPHDRLQGRLIELKEVEAYAKYIEHMPDPAQPPAWMAGERQGCQNQYPPQPEELVEGRLMELDALERALPQYFGGDGGGGRSNLLGH